MAASRSRTSHRSYGLNIPDLGGACFRTDLTVPIDHCAHGVSSGSVARKIRQMVRIAPWPESATPGKVQLRHTAPMAIEHNAAEQDAWSSAVAWARKALAQERAHNGVPEGHAHQDPDLVVAVAAWVRWEQPPMPGVMMVPHSLRTPQKLPPGSPYELELLRPLHEHAELPEALTAAWGSLTLLDRLYANMGVVGGPVPTGRILEEIRVEHKIFLSPHPDDTGETHTVQCPLCDRNIGIRLRWDGQVARALCPQGHAEWTPQPLFVSHMWEQLKQQVSPTSPDDDFG